MVEDVPVTDPTPTGSANKRLSQTVMDMVRSLALVLVAVGVVTLLVWRPTSPSERAVDLSGSQEFAQTQAEFTVLVPSKPDGLEATSARWQPTAGSGGVAVWHAGFVVEGSQYLQVSQGATDGAAAFIDEQTAGGVLVGEQVVGTTMWERYETAERRSLVRTVDGVTTIVSGTVDWNTLVEAAASLRS